MPLDRSQIRKGSFIIGGAHRADPVIAKRAPLPDDLAHFEQSAALADRLAEVDRRAAAGIAEIASRLAQVRRQLDEHKKARGK